MSEREGPQRERELSEPEVSQRERGARRVARLAPAPAGPAEERE